MEGYRFTQKMFDTNVEFAYFKKAYWLKLFYHDMSALEAFSSEEEALKCSTEKKFSILGFLSDSFKFNNKFEFLLDYPELHAYNTWKQTNNPLKENETGQQEVDGFVPKHTGAPRSNWGGLVYTAVHPRNLSRPSLLNGTPNKDDDWYFAIASYGMAWGPNTNYFTIPANSTPVNIVSLWVKFPYFVHLTCELKKRIYHKLLFFVLFLFYYK